MGAVLPGGYLTRHLRNLIPLFPKDFFAGDVTAQLGVSPEMKDG